MTTLWSTCVWVGQASGLHRSLFIVKRRSFTAKVTACNSNKAGQKFYVSTIYLFRNKAGMFNEGKLLLNGDVTVTAMHYPALPASSVW